MISLKFVVFRLFMIQEHQLIAAKVSDFLFDLISNVQSVDKVKGIHMFDGKNTLIKFTLQQSGNK